MADRPITEQLADALRVMREGEERNKRDRFLSVYGAMVALQVWDWTERGRWTLTDPKVMRRFVCEARRVAQLSEEAQDP